MRPLILVLLFIVSCAKPQVNSEPKDRPENVSMPEIKQDDQDISVPEPSPTPEARHKVKYPKVVGS